MKLLYNEKFFCMKSELLNFNIILPLAKLDMVNSRLVSNGLIFFNGLSASTGFTEREMAMQCYIIVDIYSD